MRKALFTGTFDPYTIGHDSVVRRALTFMDEIVIAVVERNVHKQSLFSNEQRVKMIRDL
jgi:pantetheine-phosphate adenylyltransferase